MNYNRRNNPHKPTKTAHFYVFCGLRKLNTLNLRLFHTPLNSRNHFSTVLIKTNWYTTSCKYFSCRSLTELEIPSTLKEVGDGCFNGCKGLLTLDFSSTSISELPKECFLGCSGLRIIKLPASLSVIGSSVFSSCEKLDDIVLPSAVTGLGDWCFYNCTSLTSIDIPASVKSINDRCFSDCI